MNRKENTQGLLVGAVALAILLGAFLSSPIAANQEIDQDNDSTGSIVARRGSGGLPPAPDDKDAQGSDNGGDSTDPDWFGVTSWSTDFTWSGTRLEFSPTPTVYGSVDSPFVFVANWLLQQVSSRYLSLW